MKPAFPVSPGLRASLAGLIVTTLSTACATDVDEDVGEAEEATSSITAPGVLAEDLGPASRAFPIVGAQLVDDRLYLVSRNLTPSRLVAFDLTRKRVAPGDEVRLPVGVGAWGMAAADGRRLYIGQFGAARQGNLLRVDPGARPLAPSAVAALDAQYIWDLDAAPDGVVYGAASRPGPGSFVFAYDPATNRANEVGVLEPNDHVRSVAASDAYVYSGGSTPTGAILRATSRRTGASVRLWHTQIAGDRTVYTLRRTGSLLAAGTHGPSGGRAAIAVLDTTTNAAHLVRAGRASDAGLDRPELIDAIAIAGRSVYFTARPSGRLYRYDFGAAATVEVGTPVARSETRGLFVHRGLLVGASAEGTVWTFDPRANSFARYALLGAGVAASGELSQSIAADATRVYVGGNFGVQARDVRTRATYRFFVPGEAKDMTVVNGRLYMAMYPVGELWAHTPGTRNARPVARFPVDQNRPTVIRHAPGTDYLFVGTASDSRGGGALLRYDLSNGRTELRENPFRRSADDDDGRQSVTSLAVAGGVVYLGGGSVAHPRIAARDARTLAELWRLDDPAPGAGAISGMVERGGRLYGFTSRGRMIVVDVARRAVVGVASSSPAEGGRLVVSGGRIYGASQDAVRRFDPATGAASVIASRLAGAHWGYPALAAGPGGTLYALDGTNLARLRVGP